MVKLSKNLAMLLVGIDVIKITPAEAVLYAYKQPSEPNTYEFTSCSHEFLLRGY